MRRGIDLAAHLDLRYPSRFLPPSFSLPPVSYTATRLLLFFPSRSSVGKFMYRLFSRFSLSQIRWMSQIWIRWDPFIPAVRFRIIPLSLSRSLSLCFGYVFYDPGYYRWILIVSWVWRLICDWIYRLFFCFCSREIYINRFNFLLRKNSDLHNLHRDCAMMNELNWQAFFIFLTTKERERR